MTNKKRDDDLLMILDDRNTVYVHERSCPKMDREEAYAVRLSPDALTLTDAFTQAHDAHDGWGSAVSDLYAHDCVPATFFRV